MNSPAHQSDCRLSASVGTRTAPTRRFDRYDGLILAMATMAGMLAAAVARSLEPPPSDPLLPAAIGSPIPLAPSAPGSPISLAPSAPGSLIPLVPSAAGSLTEAPFLPTPVPYEPVFPWIVGMSRPYLTAWTLAFPILRLRRPRPPRRALGRQPGMMACSVATLVLLVQLSAIILRWALALSWTAIGPSPSPGVWSLGAATPAASPLVDLWLSIHSGFLDSAWAAHGIGGAWLIMALGGWWRPERSGIDRLGRALGAAWIAVMVPAVFESFQIYPF
jgi:hypothetical protein